MAETQNLTSTEQAIVDSELTNIGVKPNDQESPYEYALKGSIRLFLDDLVELESSGSNFHDLSKNFERALKVKGYQGDKLVHDLKYLKNYSISLQSWKGTVTQIENDVFIAELEDLTTPGTKEVAEIDVASVSPDDLKLLEVGACFYWNIGMKMTNGQISKESVIRFQRIINWDEDDFDKAADSASSLYDNLNIS